MMRRIWECDALVRTWMQSIAQEQLEAMRSLGAQPALYYQQRSEHMAISLQLASSISSDLRMSH